MATTKRTEREFIFRDTEDGRRREMSIRVIDAGSTRYIQFDPSGLVELPFLSWQQARSLAKWLLEVTDIRNPDNFLE
jgi:hypothetical protein